MKGKKIDFEFLNEFISQSLLENKFSMEEIILSAQDKINYIDIEIKKIEELKKTRCKLLDVINNLSKSEKIKKDYSNILNLFKIKNHNICKKIIFSIEKDSNLDSIKDIDSDTSEVLFCYKQLLEQNVLQCRDNVIYPGDFYQDYKIFVLKEI